MMDDTHSEMDAVDGEAEHEREIPHSAVPTTADNSETNQNGLVETPPAEAPTVNGNSTVSPEEDQTLVIDRRGALASSSGSEGSSSSGTEDSDSDTASSTDGKQEDKDDDAVIVKVEPANDDSFGAYRSIVCYDSSTSSDSDEDILAVMKAQKAAKNKAFQAKMAQKPPTTEGEILPENLPEIEELSLEVNTGIELKPLGSVSSIVDSLVVVQSLPGSPGLDCDSVIFREDRTAIGRVFDLFGPVISPYYSIRFNSRQHAIDCGIHVGMNVFYAPGNLDFSKFVLLTELKKQKGSDASWRHDNEPPAALLEYSDDETEKREKRKLRGAGAPEDSDSDTSAPRIPVKGRRRTTAKRFHPRGPAAHSGMRPPAPRSGWSRPPFSQPAPLSIGDWRSRPPPPMEGWARAPRWGCVSHPTVPPPCPTAPGQQPWFAPPQLDHQGYPSGPYNAPPTIPGGSWHSPSGRLPPPPIIQPDVPASPTNPPNNPQQPPMPDPSDPQFRELFNKYFDYYSNYYRGQNPS